MRAKPIVGVFIGLCVVATSGTVVVEQAAAAPAPVVIEPPLPPPTPVPPVGPGDGWKTYPTPGGELIPVTPVDPVVPEVTEVIDLVGAAAPGVDERRSANGVLPVTIRPLDAGEKVGDDVVSADDTARIADTAPPPPSPVPSSTQAAPSTVRPSTVPPSTVAPSSTQAPAAPTVSATTAAPPGTTITTKPGSGDPQRGKLKGVSMRSVPNGVVKGVGADAFAVEIDTVGELTGRVGLEVEIAYGDYVGAHGADWEQRLQIVEWTCPKGLLKAAKEKNHVAGKCGRPTVLSDIVNDTKSKVLRGRMWMKPEVVGGVGESRFAKSGSLLGLASTAGSFAATPLSAAGSWKVSGNSGDFTYSVPLPGPPAGNGFAPSVSLEYSSDGANGITSAVNSQVGEVGIGWSLSAGHGYIERRYLPCTDSRIGGGTDDTCWYVQNATIVLNGRSSELVPVNGTPGDDASFTLFRLEDDPDWLVERQPGASPSWWVGERWVVRAPDGIRYYFGLNDEGQNSTLTRPVRGLTAGMPCYSLANRLCTDMPYKWMLSAVTDSALNRITYKYHQETNYAMTLGGPNSVVQYARNAVLLNIYYGQMYNLGTGYTVAYGFTYTRRCVEAGNTSVNSQCPGLSNATGTSYPDVPTDLVCAAAPCYKPASFFTSLRLSMVSTSVKPQSGTFTSGAFSAQWRLWASFPDPGDGGNEKLWLADVYPVAPTADPANPPANQAGLTPGTHFDGFPYQNRKDGNPPAGVPHMGQFRITRVTDELGAQTSVAYESPDCGLVNPNWSVNATNCYPMYASFVGGGSGWGIYRRWVVDYVDVHDLVAGAAGAAGDGSAPAQRWNYTYSGPGWHFHEQKWWSDTPNVDDTSWGQWRGYKEVSVVHGLSADPAQRTKTTTRYYQGMHGDVMPNGGVRSVTFARAFSPPTDVGYAGAVYDEDWMAGSVYETVQWDGDNAVNGLSQTRAESTYNVTQNGVAVRAGWPAPTTRKWRFTLNYSVIRDASQTPAARYSRQDTSYDWLGRKVAEHSTGFLDAVGDETCTRTFYLDNAATPSTTSPGWMNLVVQTASYNVVGTRPTHAPYAPGGCDGAANAPVGVTRSFYWNNAFSAGAEAANPMAQAMAGYSPAVVTASLTKVTGTAAGEVDPLSRYVYARGAYDAAGRTTSAVNANGQTTSFGFDAAYGFTNSATYPGGLTTSAVIDARSGQPLSVTDQNGRVTNYCYDGLFRVTHVYIPNLTGAATTPACGSADFASRFTYSMGSYVGAGYRQDKEPAIVVSERRQAPGVYIGTSSYLDGLGRTRETQAPSPTAGKIIVSASLYDDRGNVSKTVEPFVVSDGVGGDRTSAGGAGARGFASWPSLPTSMSLNGVATNMHTNVTTYDTINRATSSTRFYGSTAIYNVQTEYRGTVTVTKPQIGSWSSVKVDGLGRTVQTKLYNGQTEPATGGSAATGPGTAGAVNNISYTVPKPAPGFWDSGMLSTQTTDDFGNARTVLTDLAGRTVTTSDPNGGATWFSYDAVGNVIGRADAENNFVCTTYDGLDRPTLRYGRKATCAGAPTAAEKLAGWVYDGPAGTPTAGWKGMAYSESSWQGGQEYKTTFQYDNRYQVTYASLLAPGVVGSDPLAGEWRVWMGYNESGQVVQQDTGLAPVAPGAANPAVDQLMTSYTSLGQPYGLWRSGVNYYVVSSSYDDLGRKGGTRMSYTNTAAEAVLWRQRAYHSGTRDVSVIASGWDATPANTADAVVWFDQPVLSWDAAGRLTSVQELGVEPGGAASATVECFVYDQWSRLVRAHSAGSVSSCASSSSAAVLAAGARGRDEFDELYVFDDINRMTSKTNKLTGVATTYSYGAARPHAVASTVTGSVTKSFEYNAVGSMTRRNGAGTAGSGTVLVWDTMNRLTAHGSDQYLYTTSNQRLVRQQGATRTLYVWGMEVTATGATRTLTGLRTLGGELVATEKNLSAAAATSQVWWACGNVQRTVTCEAPRATTLTPPVPARKRYLPYGGDRSTTTLTASDRQFLGQPKDTSGLAYLNNRYYDPTVGVFVSVDPLVATTGQPYLYADGNPATLSDPTGLCSAYVYGVCVASSADRKNDDFRNYGHSAWSCSRFERGTVGKSSCGEGQKSGGGPAAFGLFWSGVKDGIWDNLNFFGAVKTLYGLVKNPKQALSVLTGLVDLGIDGIIELLGVPVQYCQDNGLARCAGYVLGGVLAGKLLSGGLGALANKLADIKATRKATNTADDAARFVVDSAGNTTLRAQGPNGWINVSEHAAERMTQRGISIEALDSTLTQQPFQYWQSGAWQTGYYGPVTKVFVGTVNNNVTTVINNASQTYINNVMARTPPP
jgi:RHS repeat-associated protein